MNTHIKSIGLSIVAMVTTVLGTQVGAAETTALVQQVHVSYADLNLGQSAGAATLYRRIANAASKVCPDVGRQDIAGPAHRKACIVSAIQRAVAGVNAPELTRYYRAKTGKSPDSPALATAGK